MGCAPLQQTLEGAKSGERRMTMARRAAPRVPRCPPRGPQRQGDAAANTNSYGTTLRVL